MGLNLDFSLSEFTPAVETAVFEIAFEGPRAEGSDVKEVIVLDYVKITSSSLNP